MVLFNHPIFWDYEDGFRKISCSLYYIDKILERVSADEDRPCHAAQSLFNPLSVSSFLNLIDISGSG